MSARDIDFLAHSPVRIPSSRLRGNAIRVLENKVRVVVRVRPFLESELQKGGPHAEVCVAVVKGTSPEEDDTLTLEDPRAAGLQALTHYKLDAAYAADEDADTIFQQEVVPLLDPVMRGYNATVFAYGATGSGKTFTMQGTDTNPGIMPLSVQHLLELIETSDNPPACQLTLSFLEVYMDRCYDLLEPKAELQVLEDAKGDVHLPGLAQAPFCSVKEFESLFNDGCQRRTTGATGLNDVSSRSHAVLVVTVTHLDDLPSRRVQGKLHLIDLAGNEDNRRTGNDGERMAESSRINTSLFVLSKVITALNAGDSRIPYRDSKLTRLLQDSLGGSSRSVLVACLAPSQAALQENQNTLSLASKSRQVVNHSIPHSINATSATSPVDRAAQLQAWLESRGKTPKRSGPLVPIATPKRMRFESGTTSSVKSPCSPGSLLCIRRSHPRWRQPRGGEMRTPGASRTQGGGAGDGAEVSPLEHARLRLLENIVAERKTGVCHENRKMALMVEAGVVKLAAVLDGAVVEGQEAVEKGVETGEGAEGQSVALELAVVVSTGRGNERGEAMAGQREGVAGDNCLGVVAEVEMGPGDGPTWEPDGGDVKIITVGVVDAGCDAAAPDGGDPEGSASASEREHGDTGALEAGARPNGTVHCNSSHPFSPAACGSNGGGVAKRDRVGGVECCMVTLDGGFAALQEAGEMGPMTEAGAMQIPACAQGASALPGLGDVVECDRQPLTPLVVRTNLGEAEYSVRGISPDGEGQRTPLASLARMTRRTKHVLEWQLLQVLSNGTKDQLLAIRGIGEKRAAAILGLRVRQTSSSEEPIFRCLRDLAAIGLSMKQAENLIRDNLLRHMDA